MYVHSRKENKDEVEIQCLNLAEGEIDENM